jgi:hypothetical protein
MATRISTVYEPGGRWPACTDGGDHGEGGGEQIHLQVPCVDGWWAKVRRASVIDR